MKRKLSTQILVLLVVLVSGCKDDFLDIKQNIRQAVPYKITDFQAILDNAIEMNASSSHSLGILGGDEYYILDGRLSTIKDAFQRNGYIWAKEIHEGETCADWNTAYSRILLANLSLEGIGKINPSHQDLEAWKNVKGSGLFFRALNFYQLAQLFCKAYDPSSAGSDPGIPLRLESDINVKSFRATVAQTYARILEDLKQAAELLPDVPMVKSRPSRPAAYGLLAKTYLLMGEYEQAYDYADQCLRINNNLVNLKTLSNLSQNYPLTEINVENNKEVIFLLSTTNIALIASPRFNAATELLKLYAANDLRKDAWFFTYAGRTLFGGGYIPAFTTGLGVNEILLIRAECLARKGEVLAANEDINYLLKNRYDGTYMPVVIQDKEMLLALIISERRKELVMRGTRWEDLRRLNKDPKFAITLKRSIDGKAYELPPNDPRYVYPIPEQEILMSKLAQNIR